MPDIFDEIDEDLRADRARKLLARYGSVLVGGAVLIVAATGGWKAWQWRQAGETERVATAYLAASHAADAPAGPPERLAAESDLGKVAAESSGGYRALARLREAALKADGGDLAGALALWDAVAGDSGADRVLRDVATLQWALHQIDNGNPAQVEARLKPLTDPGNPLHAMAEEAQALLALRQDNKDAARDLLKRLAQDTTAPEGVRGRANGLLAQLGG